MGYPLTPFDNNFNTKILIKSHADTSNNQVDNDLNLKLSELLKWLCSTPKVSSYRVNTLKNTVDNVFIYLRHQLQLMSKCPIDIQLCPHLPEVILVHNVNVKKLDLEVKPFEVIVDENCAAAILRGAPIFAPGIMGMQSGIKIGDHVSIYADLKNNCRKGYQKEFTSKEKLFLGNGIAKMTRSHLFGRNSNPNGIAVQVYSNISGCITPDISSLPMGSCLLQNLPSIICVHTLNPQVGEVILDMCASPGNKTTHIAALMENKGTLIAIDKTPSKIKQLKSTCTNFHVNNVHIYQADSTKLFNANIETSVVTDGYLLVKNVLTEYY